ncbi:MAG TPA: cytochrome c oxidase accessory protein CcoG [Burkholderiales bacterium]|nr:cytochrome c oxidase accessory protein CcoG [Burkholderiales bacterium]
MNDPLEGHTIAQDLEGRAEARSRTIGPAREAEQALYAARKKIYPRTVHGRFDRWRWAMVWFTQVIFYGLPWLEWNERQAVLFDLAARKFYIFGFVFWPQDFIYLTALLIISALALFLFTALGGRLWCGYACPQTVYTEIFMWIERKIEGGRAQRMLLDEAPMGPRKIAIKAAKHGAWIAVALWTGFTFVGYFTPIKELWGAVMSLSTGPWETFWILFYGFATYGNAGWMREQVCKYMCPYARFQSAMFDRDTMIVTYDVARGEPRGPRSRKVERGAVALGDCVNCGLCVQVCPTGIDIRKGLQYECIGCAACIDACDQVMGKFGYPPGLIRYSTENALERGWDFRKMVRRVFRTRTLIYGAILLGVTGVLAGALYLRVPLKVDIVRDRASLAREVEGGRIENVYRIQLMNTQETPHRYRIAASGLPGIGVASETEVEVPAATTRQVPLRVQIDPGAMSKGSHRIEIDVQAVDDARIYAREQTVFLVR